MFGLQAELEDEIIVLRDMLTTTEEAAMAAGEKLSRIRNICRQELAVNDMAGGRCGGYKRILAVLDADK